MEPTNGREYTGHKNGFVQHARPLGKQEAGSAHVGDVTDVIFPYIDMCLIT